MFYVCVCVGKTPTKSIISQEWVLLQIFPKIWYFYVTFLGKGCIPFPIYFVFVNIIFGLKYSTGKLFVKGCVTMYLVIIQYKNINKV